MSERTVCWFSCGAASAVATKLTVLEVPDALVVYCETGSEHSDNARFLAECERWFDRPIERIRSVEYSSTWDVWQKRRFLSGPAGAPCTRELKFFPRQSFQRPDDMHVFGYTADATDQARAERMKATYPYLKQRTPLIERGLTKSAVLAMVEDAGISLPPLYGLGFQNNNCIPCVKATSPSYWALVRRRFPAEFARMAALSRELNVKLAIVGRELGDDGKLRNVRAFIDEIAVDQPTTDPIVPSCDFLCTIAEQEMQA